MRGKTRSIVLYGTLSVIRLLIMFYAIVRVTEPGHVQNDVALAVLALWASPPKSRTGGAA